MASGLEQHYIYLHAHQLERAHQLHQARDSTNRAQQLELTSENTEEVHSTPLNFGSVISARAAGLCIWGL